MAREGATGDQPVAENVKKSVSVRAPCHLSLTDIKSFRRGPWYSLGNIFFLFAEENCPRSLTLFLSQAQSSSLTL